MARQVNGFLAIWSTVSAEVETDYLHWLTREHVFERVGVDGFHSGRVFKRISADPSVYFILYELDNSSIMASPQYLDRLNSPTPWSQRIMPILGRFRRGGGRLVAGSAGKGAGTFVAVLRFDHPLPASFEDVRAKDFVEQVANIDMIASVRIFSVAEDSTRISTLEKSMRRGDESSFGGLLIIEGVNEDAVSKAVQLSRSKLAGESAVVEVFAQVFSYHGG